MRLSLLDSALLGAVQKVRMGEKMVEDAKGLDLLCGFHSGVDKRHVAQQMMRMKRRCPIADR